ncbi:MAG TPA: tetratricopeptide repeat protein [Acidimicrobiales bacterium]|nr:tetratricopeptide repeat protein [Acidimicrobiales bacterium]
MIDSQGLEVATDSPATMAAIDAFGESFLGYGLDAPRILDGVEADPGCVMARSLAAALHLFDESPGSRRLASDQLAAARPHLDSATPRERLTHEGVEAWARCRYDAAMAAHEEIAARWPRDLVSVKFGQYHAFNRGDTGRMLQMIESVIDHNDDRAYAHGMYAFALEQTRQMAMAEREGRLATSMQRREPWAHHAVAHCLDSGGRLQEGVEWMHSLSDTWADCNSFMYTHNWWHTAVFHLDRDEPEIALQIYDRHVWPVLPTYSQDQIGAVALLARLEVRDVDVGDRWEEVAGYLDSRTGDHVEPFLDLHYLYGLARAGHLEEARLLLSNIEDHAGTCDPFVREAWAEVAVPAARALLAHATGQWRTSLEGLTTVLPRLQSIGGSHAQRDLFGLLHWDAARRAGDHLTESAILGARIRSRPSIPWFHRERARALTGLGRIEEADSAREMAGRTATRIRPWETR